MNFSTTLIYIKMFKSKGCELLEEKRKEIDELEEERKKELSELGEAANSTPLRNADMTV